MTVHSFSIKCPPCINYMQYPWGYALPVSHIISTRESYPQYPWGYVVPVSHILSTREGMLYLWGYAVPVREVSFILHSYKFTHGYWGYDSRALMIWLTGTAYPHRYWGYDSRVLRIWLMGNAYPHGYWRYDSRVLMIWLTGNAYPHGYCIPSRVLQIVHTGWCREPSHGSCTDAMAYNVIARDQPWQCRWLFD